MQEEIPSKAIMKNWTYFNECWGMMIENYDRNQDVTELRSTVLISSFHMCTEIWVGRRFSQDQGGHDRKICMCIEELRCRMEMEYKTWKIYMYIHSSSAIVTTHQCSQLKEEFCLLRYAVFSCVHPHASFLSNLTYR